MKPLILILLNIGFCINLCAQNNDSTIVTIVDIQEVTVYGKQGLSVIESKNKKDELHVCGKGKTSLVSMIPIDKNVNYKICAVEFFFNYQWRGFENEGFLIRPLVLRSAEGIPDSSYLTDKTEYFVGKKINEKIYIDLSGYNLQINDASSFFIGVEFIDEKGQGRFEDFNVTMVLNKKSDKISFLKGSCPECKFAPLDVGTKNGVSLKYNLKI